MSRFVFFAVLVSVLSAYGCGSPEVVPCSGAAGCVCYPNETCDAPLSCDHNLCGKGLAADGGKGGNAVQLAGSGGASLHALRLEPERVRTNASIPEADPRAAGSGGGAKRADDAGTSASGARVAGSAGSSGASPSGDADSTPDGAAAGAGASPSGDGNSTAARAAAAGAGSAQGQHADPPEVQSAASGASSDPTTGADSTAPDAATADAPAAAAQDAGTITFAWPDAPPDAGACTAAGGSCQADECCDGARCVDGVCAADCRRDDDCLSACCSLVGDASVCAPSDACAARSDPASGACAQLIVLAEDGTYLGRASSDPFASDGVCNSDSDYGDQDGADSIWNPHGRYGSADSADSAYSLDSGTPPTLYCESSGDLMNPVTKNSLIPDALDPDNLCDELAASGY
jgi:hypothetical protein